MIFRKNIFGHYLILRRLLTGVIGLVTYPMYTIFNRTTVKGLEVLDDLPDHKVLFVSNHQTYFSDVILMYHAFAARRLGMRKLGFPWYVFNPRLNTYFIAARETMKAGVVPKLFAYTGAIQIKRTWREAGHMVDRPVEYKDIRHIMQA